MIYELRIYNCVPGRMPALLKRFETVTLDMFKKHGIRQAGFWTTLVGELNQNLFYLLAWELLAEREKKWNAFADRPGMDRQARRDREGRPDRRLCVDAIPRTDGVFIGQIGTAPVPPWPAGLTWPGVRRHGPDLTRISDRDHQG